MKAGELDRRLRIERPAPDDALDGAGSGTWQPLATVWAGVRDRLPSRGERSDGGFNVAARPTRVRMRYRGDVTPDMRFALLRWDVTANDWQVERLMQIVAGPAELGRRVGEEFVAEEYTPAGNPA